MPVVGDYVKQLFSSWCEFRSGFFFGLFETDFNGAVDFSHIVGSDASRGWAALNFSCFEAEFGIVPGAGDAAVFDRAKGDRGISVGAHVIERVDFSLVPDEGDAVSFQFIRTTFAFFEFR